MGKDNVFNLEHNHLLGRGLILLYGNKFVSLKKDLTTDDISRLGIPSISTCGGKYPMNPHLLITIWKVIL